MFNKAALVTFSFLAVAFGQQVGTLTAETHPSLSWEKCTTAGGCVAQPSGSVTLDANWRWVHSTTSSTNCYTGNTWDATLCPDATTCAQNCALDGADYENTYGITASDSSLTLKFVQPNANGKNVGSRVYLMASNSEYEMFKLLNQEFTFDVDVSNLPCGLNGAVYFSQMDADGGLARFPTNKAGAQYGTGYCDSQCPRDIKFIDGLANSAGWTPDSNSANSGTGSMGTCCNEMDIWEANSISAAVTPHPCTVQGQTSCTGDDACAVSSRYTSVCDPDGCDFNSFRMGNTTFLGPDMIVDTTKPFTVVTQFLTDDGHPELSRQHPGLSTAYNSITTDFCNDQKAVFGDTTDFQTKGGLGNMGEAFASGMVLVLSLWDDYAVNMLWLDSDYPTTADPTSPGVARGTCSTDSGVPATIETSDASASVVYSNIKFGDLNSTYSASSSSSGGGGTTVVPTTTTPGGTTTALSALPVLPRLTMVNAVVLATVVPLPALLAQLARSPTLTTASASRYLAIGPENAERSRCRNRFLFFRY
ncbi:cellobiohydrolase I-II [Gymnopilus junonius]|uniref:Glucanase n=1 Tax=Gymnopilus junonius TaxID=109634 RepID=A0A9P5NEH4_GYMJU|nr:cellobiohydrolase I-II [Gymnopilus junonius]